MIEVNAATLVAQEKKEENSSKFIGQRVSIFISKRPKVVLRIFFVALKKQSEMLSHGPILASLHGKIL